MLLLHIFNELFIFREPVWKSYRIDLPENVIGRLIGKKGSGLAKYKKIPGVQKVYINLEMKHYCECYLEVREDTISTCNRVYEEVKKNQSTNLCFYLNQSTKIKKSAIKITNTFETFFFAREGLY